MNEETIQDPVIFQILAALKERGHEKLPLAVVKEKQNYIVGHKRKRYLDDSEYLDKACKITYVKKSNTWKLYWMSADIKWHLYDTYTTLDELL